MPWLATASADSSRSTLRPGSARRAAEGVRTESADSRGGSPARPTHEPTAPNRLPAWLHRWFDNHSQAQPPGQADGVNWLRCLPFLAMHLAALSVLWTGWSAVAITVAATSYFVRMFAVTGFYHRYFSHRAFRTSRALQAVMAFIGGCAVQRDSMWWASHHTQHHAHSDAPGDPHSPSLAGFLGSHAGWFMTAESFPTR